ncbi:MAG: radical SAM protein [Desulfobacterales bacterium]|nr:MAG: radical SAM protein [Desulfobacterales bacterium]
MRVLLVSANTEQINMPVLPLGLACVAASLLHAENDVKILNLMMQADTRTALREAITAFNPALIGVSVRNIDDQNMENPRFLLEAVKDVVKHCRKFSAATIVLGGAGYSIFPQAALDFLAADIGIQGEGERVFLHLLDRLREKEDLAGIPGLYLPDRDRRCEPGYIKKLNDLPLPLPNIHLSIPSTLKDQQIWIPFQTRRGCPMNCSYCATATIEGRIIRTHAPRKVVEALARYAAAGWNHFFFVDNTFNLPPAYAEALCEQLISAKLNITWRCILYPWKVDDNLVEKMATAGCREVSLGFEIGSEKILAKMNKKYRPADVDRIAASLKKFGIRRMGFLLLGGPGETQATVCESLSFADALDLEALKITIGIRIYPDTSLAQTAIKEGLIQADDNLLFPKYYLAQGLEGWLRQTVHAWMESRPHWLM